jgi:hypothetical protein
MIQSKCPRILTTSLRKVSISERLSAFLVLGALQGEIKHPFYIIFGIEGLLYNLHLSMLFKFQPGTLINP